MIADILDFGALWALFLMGFVFADYFFAKTGESLGTVFLSLFAVSAGGDVDFFKYEGDDVSVARTTVSQIYSVMLVLFSALLLINLFIAMMAQTFEKYTERSQSKYCLNLADFIVRFDRKNDMLPPPFNMIVRIGLLLWYCNEVPMVLSGYISSPMGTLQFPSTASPKEKMTLLFFGQPKVWICQYC